MPTRRWIIAMGVLTLLFASSAIGQELPLRLNGGPVLLSAEAAVRENAPPSIVDHALRLSRFDLFLDQDKNGQWTSEMPENWRFRGTGGEVLLEIFPDEVLWMRGTGIQETRDTSSWIGEVLLPEPGVAIITRSEDGIYGTFDVGNRRYALASGNESGRLAYAKQVDSRGIGRCLTGDGPHSDREPQNSHQISSQTPILSRKNMLQKSGGSSTNLDILFLYTSGAASYMGSPSTFINNLVASLNTALLASNVTGSARAVYYGVQANVPVLGSVGDFESQIIKMDFGTDHYSGLETLRNTHSADIVVLLVEHAAPSTLCGIAGDSLFIPLRKFDIQVGLSSKAYAIVSINCADNDRTFHHEVGHLLGGWHDESLNDWGGIPFQYTNCGIDAMSCGYTDTTNEFRTIMGSDAGTVFECGVSGCSRLLRFSDLEQTAWINGSWRPLGQPQGLRDGYENFVGTLNGDGSVEATVSYVADYKTPTGSTPGIPSSLNIDNCFSQHLISWSGGTGTIGWYEVQASANASYSPASDVYRGDGSEFIFYTSTTPFRARVRACNAVGCSAWKTSLPSNPNICP